MTAQDQIPFDTMDRKISEARQLRAMHLATFAAEMRSAARTFVRTMAHRIGRDAHQSQSHHLSATP